MDKIEITNINEAAYLITRGAMIDNESVDTQGFVTFVFKDSKKVLSYLEDLTLNKGTVKPGTFIDNLMKLRRDIKQLKRGGING